MGRLWRSVIVLAACLAAVIAMRIYLGEQLEMAQQGRDSSSEASGASVE